jgi:hypothetical protein
MYVYVCVFAQPQLVTEALLRRMATAVLGTGRATNAKLARLFFVIGHVAVKHLVSVEKRAVAKAKTVSAAQEKVLKAVAGLHTCRIGMALPVSVQLLLALAAQVTLDDLEKDLGTADAAAVECDPEEIRTRAEVELLHRPSPPRPPHPPTSPLERP